MAFFTASRKTGSCAGNTCPDDQRGHPQIPSDALGGGFCFIISGTFPKVPTPSMNSDLIIVLLLLGAAILMFALNRPRVDAVALILSLIHI